MQALIDLFSGLIALIAAAALAQFGVILDTPRAPEREIHRVADCHSPVSADAAPSAPLPHC